MPPPQRARPARKSARCRVGDGSPRPHPPHPQPVGSGPGRTPERTSGPGWESARPRTPHTQARGAPPGRPLAAPTARKASSQECALWGLVTGPHTRTPRTQSQWVVGPGRTPQRTSGRGWESAQSRTPRQEVPPPQAPSCRPHSAQSQLARARAVGLLTGPHARTPRTHSQWVVGPGRMPERTSGRGWESVRPRTLHTQARGASPGALVPPPQREKPARKSARCGVGDGSPRPHRPHPQPVGSGPRPHARKDAWSGVGERPTPDAPHPDKRRPPWAPSCRPHSAQSQLPRARAVGLVTGAHARTHPTGSVQPQAR